MASSWTQQDQEDTTYTDGLTDAIEDQCNKSEPNIAQIKLWAQAIKIKTQSMLVRHSE